MNSAKRLRLTPIESKSIKCIWFDYIGDNSEYQAFERNSKRIAALNCWQTTYKHAFQDAGEIKMVINCFSMKFNGFQAAFSLFTSCLYTNWALKKGFKFASASATNGLSSIWMDYVRAWNLNIAVETVLMLSIAKICSFFMYVDKFNMKVIVLRKYRINCRKQAINVIRLQVGFWSVVFSLGCIF